MTKRHVQHTKKSEEDLKSIYEYIANILQEPVIAGKQVSRIVEVKRAPRIIYK